ncbi:hypothetical protein [Psychroserpens sp. NJDZ02]|uniref:hypothetical protein n=1 Tax=Psychroserpens sp. NJDZ02 TaxID=2570561 RepID=UPI0010A8CD84|nr:hypothetical protein [Psychroserpens sp. NJDZ02]QCE42408.1 hypothetical protein E9099_13665 [Psychroserpens sp. NJDZ02]
MKRFLILVWSVIALSCGAVKDNTLNVDDRQKPLVAYAKLKPKMIKAAYDLETDRHVLGRITRYKYSNSGQLLKESIFNNEKGTLHFYHETGYTYSSNDSLLRKYDYLESAMSIAPQLTEYRYTYPSDSLKIMTQVIDSNQIDSTFITTSRDKYGNKIRCSKITDRMFVVPIRKNSNRYNQQTIETKYYYNTNNELINKIEIDKKRKDSSQTHYQYDANSQLSKVILKNGNY